MTDPTDEAAVESPGIGYARNPLNRKLGLTAGLRIAVVNPPDRYWDLVDPLPEGVTLTGPRARQLDFVHVFAERRAELARGLPKLRGRIKPDGVIWVSWPKKASSVATDISEDGIREVFLYQLFSSGNETSVLPGILYQTLVETGSPTFS